MAVLDLGKVVPEKGVDYFTESDINEIVTEATQNVKDNLKVSDLENDAGYIDKNVNDLVNYELKTNTGSTIELSIDSETYEMTLNLKNSEGTVISAGNIDLPLETMVVGATYDNENKKIILTLKNGTTLDVPVGDLVNGLQAEITSTNKLDASLVDDSLSDNKFVTSEDKANWNGKQDELTAGNNITIEDGVISASGGLTEAEIVEKINNAGAIEITDEIISQLLTKYNVSNLSPAVFYLEYGEGIFKFNINSRVAIWNKAVSGSNLGYADPGVLMLIIANGNYAVICNKNSTKLYQYYNNASDYTIRISTSYAMATVNGFSSNKMALNLNRLFSDSYVLASDVLKKTNTTAFTPTDDYHPSTKKYVDDKVASVDLSSKQDIIQYTELPTASAETVGKVVQYIGETDENYTNGYFYIGTTDSWENINIQDNDKNCVFVDYYYNGSTLKVEDAQRIIDKIYKNGNINEVFLVHTNSAIAYNADSIKKTYLSRILSSQYTTYQLKFKELRFVTNNIKEYYIYIQETQHQLTISWDTGKPIVTAVSTANKIGSTYMYGVDNNKSWTPTTNYSPVHKKYVDDSISSAIGDINTVLATLTTISEEE